MSHKINDELIALHEEYSSITELLDIGYSAVEQTPIKALKLGKGERCILINGAHHARESLTTILVLAQIEDLAKAYTNNETRQDYKVRQLLDTVSIYFVPMLNPDGIELAMSEKPSWKANGRGVDLNNNYPTLNAQPRSTYVPASQGYIGPYPFSEPETQALQTLCDEKQFELALAYHSAGQIIYWWYYQNEPLYTRSLIEAKLLSNVTGYSVLPVSQQKGGLGFTDWFIQHYKRPGYTLEIGRMANGKPLAWSEYEKVWKNNQAVPLNLLISVIQNETKSWMTEIEGQNVKGELVLDRGMVPLREAAQILNIEMTYDSLEQKIELTKEENQLSLVIGEKLAIYNGESIELVMPAYIKKGITYVPLADLLLYLGNREKEEESNLEQVLEEDVEDESMDRDEGEMEEDEEVIQSSEEDAIELDEKMDSI